MKHFVFSKRFRKPMTKKQARRAELISACVMAILMFVMTTIFFISLIPVWAEHPAEQPISGQAYMMAIRNGVDPYDMDR